MNNAHIGVVKVGNDLGNVAWMVSRHSYPYIDTPPTYWVENPDNGHHWRSDMNMATPFPVRADAGKISERLQESLVWEQERSWKLI